MCTERVTNEVIKSRIDDAMPLETQAIKRKFAYFGHVVRAGVLEYDVMLRLEGGSRSRGRPRKYWLQEVKEVTAESLPCAVEKARDRDRWKSVTRRVVRDQRGSDNTW